MNPAGAAPQPFAKGKRKISLTAGIIVAMAVGIALGLIFPEKQRAAHGFSATDLKVVSDIFLNLIKCIIVPLLFSTLVVGIAAHSDDLKAVGRLALKALVYFEILTTLALVVGLLVVNFAKPGAGVVLPESKSEVSLAKPKTLTETILHIAPSSFFKSAAENDVLQVVV